ncbi:hypothetical protein [Ancylobacter lacus]|uniref:hypothetical protein n=1 Tax=Ancylobacter lacus TaxID=2579970 RepID=UPI001BCD6EF3|nr:hypothetical protein [Ancylobacter lacus]MBS7539598.1 hypothetical protein [Ancylobacter lacus]
MSDDVMSRFFINRAELPPLFPTHKHSPDFWEQLGRTVASFGFLEETLGRAIYALTGTRRCNLKEFEAGYKAWSSQLDLALTGKLGQLADSFGRAARKNPENVTENVDEIVEHIKAAARFRNVLCHGSWRPPDERGASVPFFVPYNKDGPKEIFDTPIDSEDLKQVQANVTEIICSIMDTVTAMGWQFPGSSGPGKLI